jgi:16S rRNA C1402 (ribose-2'-O) methylase RsmI
MNIKAIKEFPTVLDGTHESCYRAYQILKAVKELLEKNTAADIISDLIKFWEEKQEGEE